MMDKFAFWTVQALKLPTHAFFQVPFDDLYNIYLCRCYIYAQSVKSTHQAMNIKGDF